jgi:hypothetical protein
VERVGYFAVDLDLLLLGGGIADAVPAVSPRSPAAS